MKRFTIPVLLVIWLCVNASALAQETKTALREWYSQDEQHSIKAAFVRYDQETRNVSLRRDDGLEITVSVDDLSARDKNYVAGFLTRPKTPNRALDTVHASEPKAESEKSDRQNLVGDAKRRHLDRYGIRWYPKLSDATALAAGDEGIADDRPIMMFRVLGDLNGFM